MTETSVLKRFMDLVIAITALICLAPFLVCTALMILITMGRPIFFTHQRSGRNKVPFFPFKFRTMHQPRQTQETDAERITPFGLFLRKYSIDELPQLLNVIFGQMSLVGPRPLLREYDDLFTEVQNQRFLVKPGITGLAQVSGRNDISWEDKLNWDVTYVKTRTIWLDFIILVKTIFVVFSAVGFKPSGESSKFGAEE